MSDKLTPGEIRGLKKAKEICRSRQGADFSSPEWRQAIARIIEDIDVAIEHLGREGGAE